MKIDNTLILMFIYRPVQQSISIQTAIYIYKITCPWVTHHRLAGTAKAMSITFGQ
jgi:hypothetical protein